jgi:hypothetical protein
MSNDRNANVKRTSGKHMGKVKPSTKCHEVVMEAPYYGVVFVGSRTACNQYWVRLSPTERQHHKVQVSDYQN